MRVLLKISGDSLKGEKEFGIDSNFVSKLVLKIKNIQKKGIELAIVIGGGNIYRGGDLIKSGVNSADSHNLSMLSTVFNGVVLKNFLKKIGINSIVMDPLGIEFLENYNKDIAKKYLKKGIIVICVGGTGNPYFTTDTGGVLRSLELECDMMIKATKVDGIYDKDPIKYSDAKFFEKIGYEEVISKNLKIMDQTAVSLAKENNHILKVINIGKESSIIRAIEGKKEGTIIINK